MDRHARIWLAALALLLALMLLPALARAGDPATESLRGLHSVAAGAEVSGRTGTSQQYADSAERLAIASVLTSRPRSSATTRRDQRVRGRAEAPRREQGR